MRDQEIVGLYEAYASIYASKEEVIEEVEQLDEVSYSAKKARAGEDIGKPGKQFAKIAKEAGKRYGSEERGKKVAGAVLAKLRKEEVEGIEEDLATNVGNFLKKGGETIEKVTGGAIKVNKIPKGTTTQAQQQQKIEKNVREETDLFDYILEYLVAEGYADTNENALVIMANMSEDWRESIVEELEQLDEISLKTKMKAYAASRNVDADYEYGSKVHDQADRIKKAIVKKHGEKAGEHAERHAEVRNFGRGTPRPKPRIEKNRRYRTTKSGKMHGQDQAKLKSDLIKRRNEG